MDQINIGERIRKVREQNGLSLQDVADKLDVNRSSVMRWEKGKTNRIKLPILEKLAQILQTSPGYLMGYDDAGETNTISRVCSANDACFLPVLKRIGTGEKLLDRKNVISYELADGRYRTMPCFYLFVPGDSMAPALEDGDRILVKQERHIENGQLGVFLIDEREWMIRRFYQNENITLKACNPYYPALQFSKDEANRIEIVGVVTESKRSW